MSQTSTQPRVGDKLPDFTVAPTSVQLFSFSAATWNTHRIHYDADYAREREGYADVIVQSHLYAAFVAQALRAAYGPRVEITRLGWQNRAIATPADTLTVSGQVDEIAPQGHGVDATLTLEVHNQRSELCIKAWATVKIDAPGEG